VWAAALVLRETVAGPDASDAEADRAVAAAAPGLAALASRALAPDPQARPDARGWLEGLLAAQRERERERARADGDGGGAR
jgi:hypothetical protein